MTNEEAVEWLKDLKIDIGQPQTSYLWHYEQPLDEIMEKILELDTITKASKSIEIGPKGTIIVLKKGKWIFTPNRGYVCSVCDHSVDYDKRSNVCPNCGTNMEK